MWHAILAGWMVLAVPPPVVTSAPPGMSIVINVDRRMLSLRRNDSEIARYPVAVGKPSTPSPLGVFRITRKAMWGGGFGTRWMELSVPWGVYGIHGTNRPWTVGTAASGGCFRMRNASVERVFDQVGVGTPVYLIGTASRRVLFSGDRGSEVRDVKERLSQLGLYTGPVDGTFDDGLKAVVESLQRARGIRPDGGVGERTWMALGLMPAAFQSSGIRWTEPPPPASRDEGRGRAAGRPPVGASRAEGDAG